MMNKTDFGELCAALQLAAPPPTESWTDPAPWDIARAAEKMDRAAMALHRLAIRACNGPEFKAGEWEKREKRERVKIKDAITSIGLDFTTVVEAGCHKAQKDHCSPGKCLIEWQGDPRGAAVKLALHLGQQIRVYHLGYGS